MQLSRRTLYVAALASLTGCVSVNKETSVAVWSHEDKTFVSVEIPTGELSFNWHGGGWSNGVDRYKLTVPRNVDVLSGADVVLNRGIGATDRVVPISAVSRVELIGRGSCRIEIRVHDDAGKPYALNGTYFLPRSCGR